MAIPYLPETLRGITARSKLQITTLIGDLSRSVDILTANIEHEEARAGINNLANPAYPGAGAEPEGTKGKHRRYHCLA